VLAFTVVASVLTGLLFGVIPAVQATGARAATGGGERAATGAVEQRRLRTTLVVGELALSVVLLIGAGLLVRSFVRLAAVPPGMDTVHLALLDVSPSSRRHPTDAARAAFYDAVLARVRRAPGVRAASVVSGTAGYASFSFGVRLEAEGSGGPIASQPELLPFGQADTSYFATLGIPIVQGRAFGAADLRPHADVAIVDPDLARALWPDGRAVGRRFRVDSTGPWLTVVGVAGDVRLLGADERAGRLALYYPEPPGRGGQRTIAVRTSGDPAALLPALRAAVRAVDPLQPIASLATGQARYHETLARPRFLLVLMATFAVVAVVLAGIGLYGVVSFAVAQRTREFGVRLALGAPTRTIARTVLGEGAAMTGIGVALGVAGALAGGRVLESLLFGVAPTDLATLGAVVGGLAAVALLACWLPARRASRVAPAEALRAD
jgi:putative ABC transport system permease protein